MGELIVAQDSPCVDVQQAVKMELKNGDRPLFLKTKLPSFKNLAKRVTCPHF